MTDLAIRSSQEERMDAADLDGPTYAAVLKDLARVNRWTLTARPVLAFLRQMALGTRSFSLLDVGFGHGDILRAIDRWARAHGIAAKLVGVDLNPRSAGIAQAATGPAANIDFRTGDYADQTDGFDFIVSSQVAHHMTSQQLLDFIAHMERAARRGWLISDLHRHRLSHAGYPVLARAMRVHPIVREDGRLSIARSFRPREWAEIVGQAGVAADTVRIRRRFPFRLSVERSKVC